MLSFDTLPRDCWVAVDTAQLTANMRALHACASRPVLGVVKGNGYGHGYENAAKAFLDGGAPCLGVATLSEGLLLRQLGISVPILVMGGLLPNDIGAAAQAGLEIFVWNAHHIKALRDISKGANPVRVHLEVDTGMGRGGCLPEEAVSIARELQTIKGVEITGLCTHFSSAFLPAADTTRNEIARFDQVIAALAAAGIRPRTIHAANSAAMLNFSQTSYDMLRPGMAAYGISPFPGLAVPDNVRPALTWRALITSTKILPAGHGVSYSADYRMPAAARIGLLPAGFGDGFRRVPRNVNSVLVEGHERKILGLVNMDQCMVDLNGCDDIAGSEAVLIGAQGGNSITVEELARRWNTNTYDVCTGIGARVPRRVASHA